MGEKSERPAQRHSRGDPFIRIAFDMPTKSDFHETGFYLNASI